MVRMGNLQTTDQCMKYTFPILDSV